MPTTANEHHFAAPVLRRDDWLKQHCIDVPPDVAEAILATGSRRVIATINGKDFSRGIQGGGEGTYFISFGRSLMREAGVDYGDTARVTLRPDPDPDTIDLCDELAIVLDQDAAAAARFFGMTPGRRRSLASYVNGAKREDTRIRRALDLAHKLRTKGLYSDRDDA